MDLTLLCRLELFSDKLVEKGCPLTNCFGFIDGTHIEGKLCFRTIIVCSSCGPKIKIFAQINQYLAFLDETLSDYFYGCRV